jgi:hypothetical protein
MAQPKNDSAHQLTIDDIGKPAEPPKKPSPHAQNRLTLHYTSLIEISYAEGSKRSLSAVLDREDRENRLGSSSKVYASEKALKNLPYDQRSLHDVACRMCEHSSSCKSRYDYKDPAAHRAFCVKISAFGLEKWRDRCEKALAAGTYFKCRDILG